MIRNWVKLGLLFCPDGSAGHPKLLTHAANPLPVHMDGDVFRIFYCGRDGMNRSSVGAVDIDIVTRTIVQRHQDPIFQHGPPGSFYADGVSIGNCYAAGGFRYLLFMGWQTPPGTHWRGDIGRLRVEPDLTLHLDGKMPFMASDTVDPISLSYPWVMDEGPAGFRMWYGSTRTWDAGNGEMLHVINGASSIDGHRWIREGLAVPFAIGIAQAFSRPTVIRHALGYYQMWFSFRSGKGTPYRIGYAESEDGNTWVLALDRAGIDVSPSGWDSEMIEYPFVFDHLDKRYMVYNGNGHGRTGFGLAQLDCR